MLESAMKSSIRSGTAVPPEGSQSDVSRAVDRLGESIQKTINLSRHLVERLQPVLQDAAPAGCSAVPGPAPGNTPLAIDLHEKAVELNAANDSLCDLLDRLGL